MTKRFYKDETGWYVDLPELITDGTFTKSNLAMVAGADDMLEILADGKNEITIRFESEKFEGWEGWLEGVGISMDEEYLESVGHPVQYGGDYVVKATKEEWPTKLLNHQLWLCQVCSFLFGGEFPENIYIKIIKS